MGRSKSGLFLMELIIAIAFFAVASAVCVQMLVAAHTLSRRSIGMQMAVVNAQSAAGAFKSSGGDTVLMADILNATDIDGVLFVPFDSSWRQVADIAGDQMRYEMRIEQDLTQIPARAVITITDRTMEEELYILSVSRYLQR